MRNLWVAAGLSASILSVVSCAGNPAPVPVSASRADWEILAGHWRGTYSTASPSRRGVIDFTLSAADEQAAGDVLMIADNGRTPFRPYPPGDPRLGPTNAPYTQVLTIRFVRAENNELSGTIASYWDPERSCQASATFLGRLQGRVIEGTFASICLEDVRQLRGQWRVTR
jgi:hypothetical protein